MTERKVLVFGAGVSGLTAANELIERGFDVTVYEPEVDIDSSYPSCAVGGMARSQWGRFDPPAADGGPAAGMVKSKRLLGFLPVQVDFAAGSAVLDEAAKETLADVAVELQRKPELRLIVEGYTEEVGTSEVAFGGERFERRIDRQRASAVADYLAGHGVAADRLELHAAGYGLPDELNRSAADRAHVILSSTEWLVPGEHGFRFFPSFYRHLFDTMARIPVYEGQPRRIETRRPVLENLIPTYSTGIYFEDRKFFEMPRRRITSLQSMYDMFMKAMNAIGFTSGDASRFGSSVFKYMTSCAGRRGDYERISWFDFVGGEHYSPRFRRYIDASPQFLVAMRGKVSDARTIGNILVQLLKDNIVETSRPDGTLSGPTTIAWFRNWRSHLETHGVRFRVGRLVGFQPVGDEVLPVVEEDGEASSRGADYTVIALPAQEIQKLLVAHPELAGGDYDRIRALDLGDPSRAVPGGAVEHMSGIQYFFASEVKFIAGHTHFPDSAWGLTAIFQPQFWRRRRGPWSGYRGVLSVDIGDFHTVSPATRKSAWDSTADEIATEVWRQVKSTLPEDASIPEPFLYHLDQNLEGEPGPDRCNRTPLLINRTGEYEQRPGEPDRYEVQRGGVVFAGTYMKTWTRLTTMEAANESGRHAVNAILRKEDFEGDRCMIVNPEKHEFQDLRWLVELDDRLWQAGLPHALDIIGVERALILINNPQELKRQVRKAAMRARRRSGTGIRITI